MSITSCLYFFYPECFSKLKKILYLENIQIVLRNIKDKIFNKYLLKFLWTDFPKFILKSIFEQNELFFLLFFAVHA